MVRARLARNWIGSSSDRNLCTWLKLDSLGLGSIVNECSVEHKFGPAAYIDFFVFCRCGSDAKLCLWFESSSNKLFCERLDSFAALGKRHEFNKITSSQLSNNEAKNRIKRRKLSFSLNGIII